MTRVELCNVPMPRVGKASVQLPAHMNFQIGPKDMCLIASQFHHCVQWSFIVYAVQSPWHVQPAGRCPGGATGGGVGPALTLVVTVGPFAASLGLLPHL